MRALTSISGADARPEPIVGRGEASSITGSVGAVIAGTTVGAGAKLSSTSTVHVDGLPALERVSMGSMFLAR